MRRHFETYSGAWNAPCGFLGGQKRQKTTRLIDFTWNQFAGNARSRTKIDGFASRCTSMHFNVLQVLPLAMTRRP